MRHVVYNSNSRLFNDSIYSFDMLDHTPGKRTKSDVRLSNKHLQLSQSCYVQRDRLDRGFVSSSSKSPRHLVHKHNLSFGYEREYQLLGRIVPPDAAGDSARIRLLSLQFGQQPLMHHA